MSAVWRIVISVTRSTKTNARLGHFITELFGLPKSNLQGLNMQRPSAVTRSGLKSWIPPEVIIDHEPNLFCVEVPLNDSDLVEFIATGSLDCSHLLQPEFREVFNGKAFPVVSGSLHELVWRVAWDRLSLQNFTTAEEADPNFYAHFHGAFVISNHTAVCVLVGWQPSPSTNRWIPGELKVVAAELLSEQQEKIAQFDKERYLHKEQWDTLRAAQPNLPDWVMPSSEPPPVLTAEPLISLLPIAETIHVADPSNFVTIEHSAVSKINQSNWPAPRDGCYSCILFSSNESEHKALVSWVPHTGLPSYPEVRWAIQKGIPKALLTPRFGLPGRPTIEASSQDATMVAVEPGVTDLKSVFDDLQLDDTDAGSRSDDIKESNKTEGFEAMAWLQPYHVWTEETWGIYFDARKLDDFALGLLGDFKRNRLSGSQGLAGLLAFNLIYYHELFHAQVEAVLSWQELNAHKPRYLRYTKNVYDAVRETPEWLEEALANWSAWDWFKSNETQELLSTMTSDLEHLARIVEDALNLSPPGYRDWRLGKERATWRKFANQLSTGSVEPKPRQAGFPLESAITGPLQFDLRHSDIPLRFVGKGNIADLLQRHPATLNVPGRRELERALRYFDYIVDPSAGKGAHQKWTGPDQRAFPLPTRDPVSREVFTSFLHHFGITKREYVNTIRPNI